ncbi:carbon storage regulator CsrA [Clostridium botulinum]|uniref:Translational regulator CsrA n=1 Tax=Clostridium botulinum C/D str. DC5 TaxID=1443128 RepID=A0A0A0INU5_CLOBO|nr:carbon storage regulator CsrA [Clostridium botulinum]KEI03858.1 carbon storage regulator [Clostridium botulinum C/D str. BKT75002]KEI09066.1 carbon storage regulator [Clostridium botulinum C/D str. BKT2873]KGN01842.1 carbon storage regulator [Clostridium botulinum C/D str. DC5]KOC51471.1 carbon storage regulator [Clostridium botulinum]KOC57618.1 carbon storage regulator [Clostridium botulinum]
MLVVKRKKGESILIGDDIEINIVSIDNGAVKISIDAPKNITILRKELYIEVEKENKKAIKIDMSILKKLKKK